MKKIIAALLASATLIAPASAGFVRSNKPMPGILFIKAKMEAISVVDGDYIVIIDGDTVALGGERIRLLGIDTAETFRPHCEAELAEGLNAKQRLASLLRGQQVAIVRSGGTDRYRRTLASLRVGDADVGEVLISEGLAQPYRPGSAAKLERIRHWCGPDARFDDQF